jgi:hypothetical protein
MGLPFDLEDIVGVALADVLRRAGLIIGCVGGASFLSAVSLGLGEMAADGSFDLEVFGDAMWRAFWLFLSPLTSAWGILYAPMVLAAGFYFVKAEFPTGFWFGVFLSLSSFLIVFSAPWPSWFVGTWWTGGGVADPERAAMIWRGVAAAHLTGVLGAFFWLARWWDNKRRIDEEQHFVSVTIENEHRRQQIRDTFGTDVADADFARDEKPPSGET